MTNKNTVIQIILSEDGSVSVNGNTTNLSLINWIIDKVKLQLLTAKPKEPSLIETL